MFLLFFCYFITNAMYPGVIISKPLNIGLQSDWSVFLMVLTHTTVNVIASGLFSLKREPYKKVWQIVVFFIRFLTVASSFIILT